CEVVAETICYQCQAMGVANEWICVKSAWVVDQQSLRFHGRPDSQTNFPRPVCDGGAGFFLLVSATSGARPTMTRDQMLAHLRAADEVARDAARHGHHPFGCVLVGPDDRILMRQGNIDTVRHAEAELCRRAAAAYSADFLWTCTLVATGESC